MNNTENEFDPFGDSPENSIPVDIEYEQAPVGEYIKLDVPTGRYVCVIKKCEFRRKEKGLYPKHLGLGVGYRVIVGEFKGQYLWADYMVEKPKDKLQKDFRWAFEHFLKATLPGLKPGERIYPEMFLDSIVEVEYVRKEGSNYGNVRSVYPVAPDFDRSVILGEE
jgi:hypothetical protein